MHDDRRGTLTRSHDRLRDGERSGMGEAGLGVAVEPADGGHLRAEGLTADGCACRAAGPGSGAPPGGLGTALALALALQRARPRRRPGAA